MISEKKKSESEPAALRLKTDFSFHHVRVFMNNYTIGKSIVLKPHKPMTWTLNSGRPVLKYIEYPVFPN